MVSIGGGGDEGIDGGERVRRRDVYGGEAVGEMGVGGEAGEIEDQEDEAVLSAVVGE